MEIQVRGHNMSQTASWTCFILLPPLWHFGTKAEFHSAGSGHGLGFPCAMYPEPPNAKKSCSSWVVGECHRQKLKHFVKGPSGPPIQKQTWLMEFSYWQLLFFFIFKCARTKLETSDPGISNKFWYRRLHLLKAKVSTFSSCGQWFIEPSHFHVTCSWLFVGF